MAQEIGEARETWGQAVWKQAEDFANNMKNEVRPFYIVYAAKEDPHESKRLGVGVYRQVFKAYYARPAPLLGILVWYVDNAQGIFQFVSDLSSPPDVPLNPNLLSEKHEDALISVMEKGKKMNVLIS